MIRRHLGFSVEEWQSLPWWQQWTYLEGLEAEGFVTYDESIAQEVSVPSNARDITDLPGVKVEAL